MLKDLLQVVLETTGTWVFESFTETRIQTNENLVAFIMSELKSSGCRKHLKAWDIIHVD